MRRFLVPVLAFALVGCAYPRRSTSLSSVRDSSSILAPGDVIRLRFKSAVVPPRQRGDQPWDDDGSPPDAEVRVYRGEDLIYESSPADNQAQPSFEGAETENLVLRSGAELRIELWDADAVGGDVIGVWRGRGLPRNAVLGAEARVQLEGGATLVMESIPPVAQRGTGISLYELRKNDLRVLEVIRYSPAGRAGVREGDRIVAIAGSRVQDLGGGRAASQLSMAGSRRESLSLVRDDGSREEVSLDGGYVWQTR